MTPRPEHPRPQLVRERWLNLNGEWQFEVDRGDSGLERGLPHRDLERTILVPFAPESVASGIGDTDFLHAVWYRRTVVIPADWAGSEVLLHFGAVDHDATVWVDGIEVARHRGGFTPFSAEIGAVAHPGHETTIVVRARDLPRGPQARGKQSTEYANATCLYTRTTGIWQTVWLEAVPADRIESLRITPRFVAGAFDVDTALRSRRPGLRLELELADGDGIVATAEAGADDELAPAARLTVAAGRRRPWSPGDPHLYRLCVRLCDVDGTEVDRVDSYAGLRSISVNGNAILINGERVFQRLVLDQGLWPDTLMTAPSDAALEADIRLSMAAGFNGARLHQKVFEERFLYHADRLGYLVWGEFGDWGAADPTLGDPQQPTASFVTQWVEAVQRDRNHPAIVGWCPLNETWQPLHDRITQLDDVTRAMYLATKAADPTRPVLDASGYSHRVPGADVYDCHLYEQDPAAFRRLLGGLADGRPFVNEHEGRPVSLPYAGQPYFVSEYGGIWWNATRVDDSDDPERTVSWGYGNRVRDVEEWFARFAGLTDALLDAPDMFGYCYTQLTDAFQEENGVYDARRRPKFDIARLRAVQARPAAYERLRPSPESTTVSTAGRTAP
jgi:beta-galactosidase/beta-glucuronidase